MWIKLLTYVKKCKLCPVVKPESEFPKAHIVKGKQYYRAVCEDCYWSKKKARRQSIGRWWQEFKKTLRCEDCGFADSRALDLHHRLPLEKENEVSVMVSTGCSVETILCEVQKCICLCANCHRIRHHEERTGM